MCSRTKRLCRRGMASGVNADLNDAIAATGDHQASGWVHVHAADVVLALMERGQRRATAQGKTLELTFKEAIDMGKTLNSLFFSDGLKAGVAHPYGELEAHDGVRGAFGTAFPANGLSALPAVVLRKHRCGVTEGSLTERRPLDAPLPAGARWSCCPTSA